MIINAGVAKIIYRDGYSDQLSENMLQEAGIRVVQL
jgi:deoxycytidylate deaminase